MTSWQASQTVRRYRPYPRRRTLAFHAALVVLCGLAVAGATWFALTVKDFENMSPGTSARGPRAVVGSAPKANTGVVGRGARRG